MRTRIGVLVLLLSTVAFAQAVTCPDAGDSWELEVEGKLVSSKRSEFAKWDELRIAVDGGVVDASVNIPNRTRLKLKPAKRYRFKIAANAPFGAHELWVIDAKRL